MATGTVKSLVSTLNSKFARNGTCTLEYASGNYTGGISEQSISWMRSGNIVIVSGSFKLDGTPDSTHGYARYTGIPFTVNGGIALGINRTSNDAAVLGGVRAETGYKRLVIYFRKQDGTYPSTGNYVELSLVYYTTDP